MTCFNGVYADRKVLVTGHTGFKGSWMSFWLSRLGARVAGYSLPAPTDPAHYQLLSFPHQNIVGDVRDPVSLEAAFNSFAPEMVVHMAAQPLVRASYDDPRSTFDVNVMGTVNVLEACRRQASVRAVIVVTSDKCYENKETSRSYQEADPLGGHDPYSASKGCAEIVTAAYRRSFFAGKGSKLLLASVRAGNVIGGGDWAADRLIPDLVRAAAAGKTVVIRHPQAVRPWQHVLDALGGYLLLGQKLLEGDPAYAQAWNFGPDSQSAMTVRDIVERARMVWPRILVELMTSTPGVHEAGLLLLDPSMARQRLSWAPVWDVEVAIRKTVDWYQHFYDEGKISTGEDLSGYMQDAARRGAYGQHRLDPVTINSQLKR